MTRTKAELLIAIVAVALGTVGFLFDWAPAEVLGLLFACVALGMVLVRALPADRPLRPRAAAHAGHARRGGLQS